jgi:hypothetical protein
LSSLIQRALSATLAAAACAACPAHLCASGAAETSGVQSLAYRENLGHWLELGEEQRAAVRARAQALSYGKLRELKKRYKQFQALPPEEQARITANYRDFCELDAAEKTALSKRYALYRNLPEAQRAAVLSRLESRTKSAAEP